MILQANSNPICYLPIDGNDANQTIKYSIDGVIDGCVEAILVFEKVWANYDKPHQIMHFWKCSSNSNNSNSHRGHKH